MDLIGPSSNLLSRAHRGVIGNLQFLAVRTKRHQQESPTTASCKEALASLATPRLSAAPLKVDYAGTRSTASCTRSALINTPTWLGLE
jgi:hypothetical protein